MLYRQDGSLLALRDFYRGQAAFLICAGPSLTTHDLSKLSQRGILTMAVNNAAAVYRPHLWACVDDPGHFVDAIWRDPAILKFVPMEHFSKRIAVRDEQDVLITSSETLADMPAVVGYRRNDQFAANRWLQEDTFNWGNEGRVADSQGHRGSRSVMYVALKLLFYLGVKQVYLLGCDFRMEAGKQNYAFEQDRSASSLRGNTKTYRVLNSRLAQLNPYFTEAGFQVENCTPNSGLTVFPHMKFDEAVERSLGTMPKRILTYGMYDHKARRFGKHRSKEHQPTANGDHHQTVGPGSDPAAIFHLEIVSHCWQYSKLLTYQLSSLVRYPPTNCRITMTVFHAAEDEATCRVLEYFGQISVAGVTWRWWQLETPQLFRRAIGRNMAALATSADWIWFADCDQVFRTGCLDALAEQLRRQTEACLVYPEYVYLNESQDVTKTLLQAAESGPNLVEIDPSRFTPSKYNRAIGGVQIVRGDVARHHGYCKDQPKHLRPVGRWMRTFEDVAFRKILRTQGVPVSIPGLYRIEHERKGRFNLNPAL